MIWQDVLFAAGGIVFFLALLPALRDRQKPPLLTSLTTGTWLAIFVVGYFTLGLYFAAFTTACSSAAWLTLAYQRYSERKSI